MAARSKIIQLPEADRQWLDQSLVKGSFSDYRQLAEQLQARGYEISFSAVWRYGQDFERRLGALKTATAQAKVIAQEAGDDEGALTDALIRLMQEKIFGLLVQLDDEDIKIDFADLGMVIAKLSKASVDQKKWQTQERDRVLKKLDGLEKDAKEGKHGLTVDTLRFVRESIYGLPA